jgi:hypothetical protein
LSASPNADPQKAAALVPRALLGTSIAVLAVGTALNSQGQTARGPEALSWLAAGWALVAPVAAVALRGQGLVAPAPEAGLAPGDAAARARRTVLFFAILESAAVFAGIAAIVSPPAWPLAVGLVPVAVMALNLPPRGY